MDIRSFFKKPSGSAAPKVVETKSPKKPAAPTPSKQSKKAAAASPARSKASKATAAHKAAENGKPSVSTSKRRASKMPIEIEDSDSDYMEEEEEELPVRQSSFKRLRKQQIPNENVRAGSARNSRGKPLEEPQEARPVSPKKSATPQKRAAPASALHKKPPVKVARSEPSSALEGPLSGKTFVVTGVLDSMSREEAEDLIKQHGGKMTSAVSGKTTYLVTGSVLEDGREVTAGSKYRKATEKGTKIINEQDFLALVKASDDKKAAASPPPAPVPSRNASTKPLRSSKGSASSSSAGATDDTELWADKYRPIKMDDLVGNQDNVKKLYTWLQNWEKYHVHGVKPTWNKENPGAKAVLISGPPGIGKTTAATLAAKSLGFAVQELNASDTRSKNSLHSHMLGASTTQEFRFEAPSRSDKGRVIIMDEVDGMSAGDRGGMAELIQIIKKSKVPIICICNDRQSQKVRSLANHCYDLRFRRPTKQAVAKRMLDIASMEGVSIEPNAIELLIESVGNDIRQVLNTMQMWKRRSRNMSYRDAKNALSTFNKDSILRLSPFDACMRIFNESRTSTFGARNEAYFIDYSLIPLMIQQNYVEAVRKGGPQNKSDPMEESMRLAATAEGLSDSDMAEVYIRQDQAALNVRAAYIAEGRVGFPQFPEWMGKNSTKTKMKRLLGELSTHMSQKITGSRTDVRLDYLPVLRSALLRPIIERQADGVDETVALLDDYGLSREDFTETLASEFVFSDGKKYADIADSKTKAALTRKYNQTSHMSQALVDSQQAVKKKRKAVEELSEEVDGGPEELLGEEDDEEEDDDDVSAFVAKGSKQKSSSSSTGSKRSGKAAANGRVGGKGEAASSSSKGTKGTRSRR